jgi:hypothetical protein
MDQAEKRKKNSKPISPVGRSMSRGSAGDLGIVDQKLDLAFQTSFEAGLQT